ncbi:MAG: hypothetical protein A2505_00890 [Deltaproteobacteria bacterium RIFOXYD12_FULL_55_16]|nr:MAG: hypothetical protein A2505_00890 [Deltaproteobacteria bacterium RIFOXYD12_FULL_55_16]
MKQFVLALAILPLVPLFANQAEANPKTRYDAASQTCRVLDYGPLEWESRSYGEGGKLFKNICKGCHSRDNDKGAPFLWTESKTSEGWDRIFATRAPKCAQNGAWDGMTPEQLRRLNDYLYRWAADSQDLNNNC